MDQYNWHIRQQLQMLFDRSEQMAAMIAAAQQSTSLKQLTGVKKPYVAQIEISFAAATNTVEGAHTVSVSGPFYCSAIAAFWAETTEGAFRPISSITDVKQDPRTVNSIDFEWEVEAAGSGWAWQQSNARVPSAALFSCYDEPYYLPAPYFFKKKEAIVVRATPIVAPDAAGTLYFNFIGYKEFSLMDKVEPAVMGGVR